MSVNKGQSQGRAGSPQYLRVQGDDKEPAKAAEERARVAGKDTGDQGMEDGSMTLILANSSIKVAIGNWPLASGS